MALAVGLHNKGEQRVTRLPGLPKRMSKEEVLELELAREASTARLQRLIAQRDGSLVEDDDPPGGIDGSTTAVSDAPDEVIVLPPGEVADPEPQRDEHLNASAPAVGPGADAPRGVRAPLVPVMAPEGN